MLDQLDNLGVTKLKSALDYDPESAVTKRTLTITAQLTPGQQAVVDDLTKKRANWSVTLCVEGYQEPLFASDVIPPTHTMERSPDLALPDAESDNAKDELDTSLGTSPEANDTPTPDPAGNGRRPRRSRKQQPQATETPAQE